MPVDAQHTSLGRRRGWARIRAVVACLAGVATFALSMAALAMIVLAASARLWSLSAHRSIRDAPTWSWAPGGAEALAIAAVAISFGGAFWYFWRGAANAVLHEVAATFLPPGAAPQLVNVVESLSIGLGQQPPRLWITDDPTPNAISLRSSRNRDLCVTTGALALPRAELEALCAHELGHLWAEDSHWVTAGLVAVARARRFGEFIVVLGTLGLVVVGLVVKYVDVLLWSSALFSLALIGLGICSKTVLRQLELTVRRNADEIADVQAIRLARDPNSLGDVCARLAADERRVSPVQWRSEVLWFEAVETAAQDDEVATVRSSIRSRADLLRRALAAYAEARVPAPPSVIDLQQRVAADTARLATIEATRPTRTR